MPEPAARAQDAVSLDNSPTMAMTTLYSAAVGPIGKDYYLPIFNRFEAAGQATLSWNWSACLYSVNWMIFRRLWGAALVFVGALLGTALTLVALGSLVFEWPTEMLYELLLTCLVLALVVSGAWGNALLYNRCRQAMMTAVADNKTLVQACAQLSQQAATRARFIRMLVANAVLLSLAAAATAYLMLWGNGSLTAAEAPATAPSPALAASTAEPAASAASQVASAAQAPASTASAAVDTPAAPTAEPASAPASAPAAVASALPLAMPVSAPSVMPLAASAAASALAPAAVASTAPAASSAPATSTALPASHAAAKPAKAVAASHAKAAVSAPSHATSAAHAKTPAVAKSHASVAAHAASRPLAKPAAKPALAKTAKATAAKTSQQAKVTTAPTKGLYINAGLFANPDNARNALAKLQAAGMPATAQEIETSQGQRTRIRVGPIATAVQAEATIEQIKALNLDAALVKP